MYIAVTIIAALVVVCVLLALRCIDMYTAKFGGMYVDSGGVRTIPPEYIDVIKHKTMNVKIDNEFTICIPQVSFIDGVYRIRDIQMIFTMLKKHAGDATVVKVDEKNLKEFLTFAHALAILLYSLSSSFIKSGKRKKYFNALKKKIIGDIEWTCELYENILDFWAYIKKKMDFLAHGSTPRQMYGDNWSWDYVLIHSDGSTSLLPRYANCWNTTGSEAKPITTQN
jgi:hypothetical protein